MMRWLFALLLLAWALAPLVAYGAPSEAPTLPAPPERPEPVAGQCPQAWDLVPGRPAPPGLVEIRDGQVVVVCAATAIPTSKAAHLLLVANAYDEVVDLHGVHVRRLVRERDVYYELAKPPPWHQRPGAQQTIGGAKVLVAVGLAVAVVRLSSETWRP